MLAGGLVRTGYEEAVTLSCQYRKTKEGHFKRRAMGRDQTVIPVSSMCLSSKNLHEGD